MKDETHLLFLGFLDQKILAPCLDQQCDHLHRGLQVLLPPHRPVGYLDPADQVHAAEGHGGVPVPSKHGAKNQHVCLSGSYR